MTWKKDLQDKYFELNEELSTHRTATSGKFTRVWEKLERQGMDHHYYLRCIDDIDRRLKNLEENVEFLLGLADEHMED